MGVAILLDSFCLLQLFERPETTFLVFVSLSTEVKPGCLGQVEIRSTKDISEAINLVKDIKGYIFWQGFAFENVHF